MVDRYKVKLTDAQYTWRDRRRATSRRSYEHKDVVMGRNNKRSARQADRREIDAQRGGEHDVANFEADSD